MRDIPDVDIIIGDTNGCVYVTINFRLEGDPPSNEIRIVGSEKYTDVTSRYVNENLAKLRIPFHVREEFGNLLGQRNNNPLTAACNRAEARQYEGELAPIVMERFSGMASVENLLENEECMGGAICMSDGEPQLDAEYMLHQIRMRNEIWKMYHEIFSDDATRDLYFRWNKRKIPKPWVQPSFTPPGFVRDPKWSNQYPPSNKDLLILASTAIFAQRSGLRVGILTFDRDMELLFDAIARGIFRGREDSLPICKVKLISFQDA